MSRIKGLVVARYAPRPVSVTRAMMDPEEMDPDEMEPDSDPDDTMPTMEIRFSIYNSWYEIDSWYEGNFMERVAPGSFTATIKGAGRNAKVLFDHGMDMYIGDKPLGVPLSIEDSSTGPVGIVPMLSTSYCRDIAPGLDAGAYGSSFMFEVMRDAWVMKPEVSTYNPYGLPERTIQEVALYEFGPVTWPASPEATAGLRSMSDWCVERWQRRDPARCQRLAPLYDEFRMTNGLSRTGHAKDVPATDAPTSAPSITIDAHPAGKSAAARARALAFLS